MDELNDLHDAWAVAGHRNGSGIGGFVCYRSTGEGSREGGGAASIPRARKHGGFLNSFAFHVQAQKFSIVHN